MGSCSEHDYWDTLLNKCMPCRLRCHKSPLAKCSSFCESVKCSKQTGFYYDKLLSDCVSCSDVCGQHPTQCMPFCQKSVKCSKQTGFYYDQLLLDCVSCSDVCGQHPTQCMPFCQTSVKDTAEHKLRLSQDQAVLIYTLLGICLFITFASFLLVLRRFVGSEPDQHACKPAIAEVNEKESSKDRLANGETAGGECRGSTGSRTPEPVETCRFCFPEQMPTMEEGGGNHRTPHPHRAAAMPAHVTRGGYAGTVPIDIDHEDRPFNIICSPSQEKPSIT